MADIKAEASRFGIILRETTVIGGRVIGLGGDRSLYQWSDGQWRKLLLVDAGPAARRSLAKRATSLVSNTTRKSQCSAR